MRQDHKRTVEGLMTEAKLRGLSLTVTLAGKNLQINGISADAMAHLSSEICDKQDQIVEAVLGRACKGAKA